MIGTGERTRYRVGTTLSMVLLVLSSLLLSTAYAQTPCDQIRQRIYQITSTEAARIPDSLRTVLDLASLARDCEGQMPVAREVWLLTAETFALDELGQYEEATNLVNRFFDAYFDEAPDYYRGRFYLWRLHLHALSGNGTGMVGDYLEARRYADALEPSRRAHLHLNGAYAYQGLREYGAAFELTQEAKTLLSSPQTYEDSVALARVLHMEAEVQLLRRVDLPQVMEDFRRVVAFYGALGDTSRVATATTLLGETYAASGDTSLALSEMETGVLLARKSGSARSEVYALFRQGQLLRRSGDLEAAEPILMQALNVSEHVQEFSLRIAYELAMLYEERHEPNRATSYYQIVLDSPLPSNLVAALEAGIKQQEAQSRLLLIKSNRNRTHFHITLAGLLVVLAGGVVLYLSLKRRIPPEPSMVEKKSNGVFIPTKLPTGLTLDELEQRFQQVVGLNKFGKRLAWIYAVLLDIELVLPYITDEYLVSQVKAYNVANNTALFQCVAAIEEARTAEEFTGRVENTLASYLRGEFEKREWPWPKHPIIWKQYFVENHVETLF